MILRNIVLAVAVAVLAAALLGLWRAPASWPWTVLAVLVVIGTVFERRYRNRALVAPPGGGWRATGERFHDETSGRLVTVWYNESTGERRYVPDKSAL